MSVAQNSLAVSLIAEGLAGWSLPLDAIRHDLTPYELADVQALAERIIENGAGGRTDEKVFRDCLNGKLGEYALYRRFRRLGLLPKLNIALRERWWDLSIDTPETGRVLVEVKRQVRRSASANFTRPASTETMCQFWDQLDAVVMWTPDETGKLLVPWFVMDPAALAPEHKLLKDLSKRKGFCLVLAELVEQGFALEVPK